MAKLNHTWLPWNSFSCIVVSYEQTDNLKQLLINIFVCTVPVKLEC